MTGRREVRMRRDVETLRRRIDELTIQRPIYLQPTRNDSRYQGPDIYGLFKQFEPTTRPRMACGPVSLQRGHKSSVRLSLACAHRPILERSFANVLRTPTKIETAVSLGLSSPFIRGNVVSLLTVGFMRRVYGRLVTDCFVCTS